MPFSGLSALAGTTANNGQSDQPGRFPGGGGSGAGSFAGQAGQADGDGYNGILIFKSYVGVPS